jgi:hypothetical protein
VIEDGFVKLIQARLVTANVVAAGGFDTVLQPVDLISAKTPMAWAYRSIVADPDYNLRGEGMTEWQVQVDCHGLTAAYKLTLARAIQRALMGGFSGQLPDADATFVAGIFRMPGQSDGYSDANHSYVRSLEYAVQYRQT